MTNAKTSLLLVEDEPDLLEVLGRWFQRRGIATCAQSTFEGAWRAAASESFDVAVVDGNLSGRSGLELVKFLRRLKPDMDVIFVSGRADDETRESSRAAGAIECLAKPFTLSNLDEIIARLRSARRMMDEPNG